MKDLGWVRGTVNQHVKFLWCIANECWPAFEDAGSNTSSGDARCLHQNYHVQLSKTGNLDGTEGTATIFKTPVSNFRRQGKLTGAVPANVPALILNPTFTFASRHAFDQPVTTAPSALRAQKRLAKGGSRCPTVTWHAFVAWPKKDTIQPAVSVMVNVCLCHQRTGL